MLIGWLHLAILKAGLKDSITSGRKSAMGSPVLPQMKPKKDSPCSSLDPSCYIRIYKMKRSMYFGSSCPRNHFQYGTSGILVS